MSAPAPAHSISPVAGDDLPDLLRLMRAYCDFYERAPTDSALLALSRALLADPVGEGMQLLARDEQAVAVGFATIYWTWSTTDACRVGVMNDLYVAPEARGAGLAERLIDACLTRCAERGAGELAWQTAPENVRAQTVYERVGARRETWIDYTLAVPRS